MGCVMMLRRIARALLEKATPVTVIEPVDNGMGDVVLAEAADFFMRQRRIKARVVHGIQAGVPVVWNEGNFRDLVTVNLMSWATNGYGEYPFYLYTPRINEIDGWEVMRALRVALQAHDVVPRVTNTRDIHVYERHDFFLCTLVFSMRTV